MKVLLVGATGQLGGRIARELLSRRIPVRALCRTTAHVGALRRMGAEIVIGDLKDPASLVPACDGADTVVTTANTARRGGDDTIDAVDLAGTQSLIDTARAAGVAHFVYLSVYGASASSANRFIAAKGAVEERLKASGMAWTILAPDAFMEAWPGTVVGARVAAGQPVVIVGEGLRRHSYIAEHDVAQMAVASVVNQGARDRRLEIGGPGAHSWPDVVAIYERVFGTPIEVRHVAPGEPVEGIADVKLGLLALYERFDSVFNSSAVFAEFNVPQTPLDAWVRASAASMRRRI